MSDLLAAKRRLLGEQVGQCRLAADALLYSWRKVTSERIGEADPELEETLEVMTARFARLEDLLIKRVFRAVAAVELSDAQRLLDVLDLMEQLGIVESAEQWVELRELRNTIVHEYEAQDLTALQRRVHGMVPLLIRTLDAVTRYVAAQGGLPR